MRFAVVRKDGSFVSYVRINGGDGSTRYLSSTPDSCDAHDFRSEQAARKWIAENSEGKVAVLNDDGFWPIED